MTANNCPGCAMLRDGYLCRDCHAATLRAGTLHQAVETAYMVAAGLWLWRDGLIPESELTTPYHDLGDGLLEFLLRELVFERSLTPEESEQRAEAVLEQVQDVARVIRQFNRARGEVAP